jgi:predicted DCC family thiol-disulfide oxidoreductase YuxK
MQETIPSATVVFDGDCGICQALRRKVQTLDTRGKLRFVPYQAGDLATTVPGLTREAASRSLIVVRDDGRHFRGARAAFETLRRLPGTWGAIGMIAALPPLSLLAEPFYRLIARNRGAISRRLGLDVCRIDQHPAIK